MKLRINKKKFSKGKGESKYNCYLIFKIRLVAGPLSSTIYTIIVLECQNNRLLLYISVPICPAIIDFAYGEYTCDNETNRGSICEFSCEEGYYLNTTNTTVCQDDGSWSFGEDMPECLRMIHLFFIFVFLNTLVY